MALETLTEWQDDHTVSKRSMRDVNPILLSWRSPLPSRIDRLHITKGTHMTYRLAKLQPWYHKTKPRCVVVTRSEQQCLFSATFQGDSPTTRNAYLCTLHAQLAEFAVKPLRASRVEILDR